MDFVRCDDHLINNIFPAKNEIEVVIPFEKKYNALSIRDFQKSEIKLKKRMTSSVYSILSDVNFSCLGIGKTFCSSNLLERKNNVTVGFEIL